VLITCRSDAGIVNVTFVSTTFSLQDHFATNVIYDRNFLIILITGPRFIKRFCSLSIKYRSKLGRHSKSLLMKNMTSFRGQASCAKMTPPGGKLAAPDQ
jgi:hypothetical protein